MQVFTDRSRILCHQECARRRFHAYHDGAAGLGLVPSRKALPLAVGGAVHCGLAVLLRGRTEDEAVAGALADLALSRPGGLELDAGELAAQAQTSVTDSPLPLGDGLVGTAEALGVPLGDGVEAELRSGSPDGQREFEEWLWREQSALVEGMVRAWARRRLQPLLERYEVLEVEREGTWRLATGGTKIDIDATGRYEDHDGDWEIVFMSRPDALLLERATGSLWLQSFKTAAQWDVRKEKDARVDMQGLSEGVEVERRLQNWWTDLHHGSHHPVEIGSAMDRFLRAQPAPPRILGIRYEYLLKGARREDRRLSARVGFSAWSQASPLVRNYVCISLPQRSKVAPAYSLGDTCWSYEYLKEDGSESKLAWQNWEARPVWEQDGGVRAWIDRLAASEEQMSAEDATVGLEPRALGWHSEAQALGTTAQHPLDSVLPPVVEVYRQEDEVRDWVEQVEAGERQVAEAVARVREAAADPAKRRSLLNVLFPQSRGSCVYPSECLYLSTATRPGPCFGPADLDLEGCGRYVQRQPHHEPEKAGLGQRS